jgi:hypothetical protein
LAWRSASVFGPARDHVEILAKAAFMPDSLLETAPHHGAVAAQGERGRDDIGLGVMGRIKPVHHPVDAGCQHTGREACPDIDRGGTFMLADQIFVLRIKQVERSVKKRRTA